MTEDLLARIILGVVMAASGVLLVWSARATADGRIRRNQIVGIRTFSTLASDEAWIAAHRRARGVTQWAGIAAIASGLGAALPVPIAWVLAGVIVGCLAMLVLVLFGAVVGGRAARAATASAAATGRPDTSR